MLKVVKAVRENDSIVTLTIDNDGVMPAASWMPGQFARIGVNYDGTWTEDHTFTVSSAPEDRVFTMTIKAVGPFTTRLQTITPGTEVRISGPHGKFCAGIDEKPLIGMIAGGIGITPFWSVLHHFRAQKLRNRVVLFWANNTLQDIIWKEEICDLVAELELRVVHVLWKEPESSADKVVCANQFFHTGLLTPEIISQYADLDKTEFFMCGPPRMNEAATGILNGLGILPSRVHAEAQIVPAQKKPA